MHQHSGFREPRNEGDQGDQQRRSGCERAEARDIAATNLAKRRPDDQSNGGGNRDGSVTRTAKDPEDKSCKETGVKTYFRWQVRKGRIAQRRGEQIRGERDAGENIAAQPTRIITA